MINTHTQKLILQEVIAKMIKGLENYASRKDARQAFVDQQNELIKSLVTVYNSYPEPEEGNRFSWLEQEIFLLENLDATISGHNIILRTKPKGHNFSLISKHFYL